MLEPDEIVNNESIVDNESKLSEIEVEHAIIDWYSELSDEDKEGNGHNVDGEYLCDVIAMFSEVLTSYNVELFGTKVTMVDSFGGEGQGDSCGFVFKVKDQLFRADGSYSSWDGFNWEDVTLSEVFHRQILVDKYFTKEQL